MLYELLIILICPCCNYLNRNRSFMRFLIINMEIIDIYVVGSCRYIRKKMHTFFDYDHVDQLLILFAFFTIITISDFLYNKLMDKAILSVYSISYSNLFQLKNIDNFHELHHQDLSSEIS